MPSTITHGYLGIDTIKKLNKKPQDILNKRLNNYKVYCQSTDILYFYHIMFLKNNKIQELGHDFHNKKVFQSFSYLINLNKENKDQELFTLIAGLITHYKADSIIHPYINFLSKSKNKLEHQNKHFEIETYIDNYLVNKYEKTNHKKHKHYKLIFNYEKEEVVINSLNNLFQEIYNVNNIGNIYYKALKEMHFVFKYIRHDSFGIKRKLYQLIDHNPFKIRKIEYLSYYFNLNKDDHFLNLSHRKWYNLKDPTLVSHESFLDLYDKTTNETSRIINELYLYIYENKNIDLYKLIGNNSYSNGLPLNK